MFELYSAEKDVQVDESTEKVRDAVQTAEDAILEKNEVRSMGYLPVESDSCILF